MVAHRAVGGRVLQQHAAQRVAQRHIRGVADDQVDAHRPRPGRHDRQRLRVAVRGGEEHLALPPPDAEAHRHRLGGGGRLVQQRCIRQRQAGQIADHGLEVEQGLEPTLRDLGLVRRIGRVPQRVLQHIPQDHRRCVRAVITLPQKTLMHHVLRSDRPQLRQGLRLGAAGLRAGQSKALVQPDIGGDRTLDQPVHLRDADPFEHLPHVLIAGP